METKTSSTSVRRFDSLQQEAFLNLWRTYDRLRMVEDELFSQHQLTAQQYNALRLLRAVYPESLPTLALASRLVSRAPDITRLLDRLEQQELIVRERPSENRRSVMVRLTETGLKLLAQLDQPVTECHLKQLGHLSVDELKQFTELLKRARGPHEGADSHWQ